MSTLTIQEAPAAVHWHTTNGIDYTAELRWENDPLTLDTRTQNALTPALLAPDETRCATCDAAVGMVLTGPADEHIRWEPLVLTLEGDTTTYQCTICAPNTKDQP